MRKLLTSLMVATIATSSASTAVSCGKKYTRWSEVYVITDSGKVMDKAFNESGYNAGNEVMKMLDVKTSSGSNYDGISYIESKSESDIQNNYQTAKNGGAKTLILPGYKHGGENLEKAASIVENVVVIDVPNKDKKQEKALPNVTGLLYRADISGFYSGFAAIIYSLLNDNYKDKKLRLSTFGGEHNGTAVDSFMHGYLAAIDTYNTMKESKKPVIEKLFKDNNKTDDQIKNMLEVNVERVTSQSDGPTGDKDSSWFSNSFNPGGGRIISDKLINEGSDVIMPVAGAQVNDLLSVIKNKGDSTKVKVVGVDIDQAEVYDTHKGLFITSAEKDIVSSTVLAMSHQDSYISNDNLFNAANEKYKDISVTEDADKGYEKVNITEKKSWAGTTKWFGGKFSSGNSNLLSSDLHDAIKKLFDENNLLEASKNYFKEYANKGAKELLSKVAIKEFSEKVLEAKQSTK